MSHGRTPHAQLHLPALSPDEALVFVNILERLIAAIWRAHGDAMTAYLDEVHGHVREQPLTPASPPAAADDPRF